MTEAETKPSSHVIPHITSAHYIDLHPSGFMFMNQSGMVRIVYYHDEIRVIAEMISVDGTTSNQISSFRVEDAAVAIPVEDFVRYAAQNLQAVEGTNPGILEKYGIHINVK